MNPAPTKPRDPAPRPRHIIWDWNGTLLDDVDSSFNAVNRLLSKHRLPPATRGDYLAHFGFPVRDYYLHLGFPPDLAESQWEAMERDYHAYLDDTPPALFSDVRGTLERCRAAGIPQSVLSALHHPLLMRALEENDLAQYFDHIRGMGDLHGASKLELGRQLLADIALPPDALLLVGDTLHDAHVARELGVPCVLAARGHQSAARLATAGAPVFSNLADLMDAVVLPGVEC
ncbi:MAG: HAD family hydrolase [Kiritimatiellaeota bacterium]|nr:HAD family hydrolase [Kiritimatiellota bacterium]